jgi:hypothetical protein
MAKSPGGALRVLAAGGVGAALLPTLVLAVHAPFWAAAVATAGAVGGLWMVLAPRRPFEGLDPKRVGAGRMAVVQAVARDALTGLDRLEAAAGRIRDKAVKARVAAIAAAGRGVVSDLEKAPDGLSAVERLLTYYTPRAAELAEGFQQLEARDTDPARRTAIADLLARVQDAFTHYRDQLADQSLKTLDVDMRLVSEALADDIGDASAARCTR